MEKLARAIVEDNEFDADSVESLIEELEKIYHYMRIDERNDAEEDAGIQHQKEMEMLFDGD